jgi:sortase A
MTTIDAASGQDFVGAPPARRRRPRFTVPFSLPKAVAAPPVQTPGRAMATWILGTLAFLAIWAVLFALGISRFEYAHAQHNLYGEFRAKLSAETAPLGGAITPGAPVAVLSIPSIGAANLVVVEGTASGDLEQGPGHRRDTALPGQAGVSVIYGRASLFGAPLKRIPSLKQGDSVQVTTGQGRFTYVVERVRRAGDKFSIDLPPSGARLTFVTSESTGWRSGWAPSGTLYVDAALQGKTVNAPTGRPVAVPKIEKAMHGNPDALYALVLWLGLLVIACLAAAYAFIAWGRWNTWLVATPAVLAALWGCTETAAQLLPNLM